MHFLYTRKGFFIIQADHSSLTTLALTEPLRTYLTGNTQHLQVPKHTTVIPPA